MLTVKERIVAECIRLFNEYGCRFTLDDVVKNLRISKKTIYTYFLNKEEILRSYVDEAGEDIHRIQREISEREDFSVEEKLRRILTVESKYEKQIRLDRIYEFQQFYPDIYRYIMEGYEKEWGIVEQLIGQGIRQGIYEDVNIDMVKGLLQSGMQMLYSGDFLSRNDLTYQQALEQMVVIVLSGIAKKQDGTR